MIYTLEISKTFEKALLNLPQKIVERILIAVQALAENPRPSGCKKLKGSKTDYRIRIGDYRVIYSIEDEKLVVLVLNVGHRKDIYQT
jgi:mRNA interferase RelE/StbE